MKNTDKTRSDVFSFIHFRIHTKDKGPLPLMNEGLGELRVSKTFFYNYAASFCVVVVHNCPDIINNPIAKQNHDKRCKKRIKINTVEWSGI